MTNSNTRTKSTSPDKLCEEATIDTAKSNQDVFGALHNLSERLHVALHHLTPDPAIVAMANEKIPEAVTGLDYVMQKTDEAAERTMDLVEDSTPIATELRARSGALHEQWTQFQRRDLTLEEFRPLSSELGQFLSDAQSLSERLSKNLTEILLAQEFQDLTGQVIQRVMGDVKAVEDQLRQLTAGYEVSGEPEHVEQSNSIAGTGPAVGLAAEAETVGQDDVDDILNQLDL